MEQKGQNNKQSEDSFYHFIALSSPSAIRLAYIAYKVKYGVRILDIFMCWRVGGWRGRNMSSSETKFYFPFLS